MAKEDEDKCPLCGGTGRIWIEEWWDEDGRHDGYWASCPGPGPH